MSNSARIVDGAGVVLGEYGPGLFQSPTGLCVTRDFLYVTDPAAAVVWRVDLIDEAIAPLIDAQAGLRAPLDVALAAPDQLLISDPAAQTLWRWSRCEQKLIAVATGAFGGLAGAAGEASVLAAVEAGVSRVGAEGGVETLYPISSVTGLAVASFGALAACAESDAVWLCASYGAAQQRPGPWRAPMAVAVNERNVALIMQKDGRIWRGGLGGGDWRAWPKPVR
ncbi:hypothetical protein MAIT1_03488 [Magnetofaba australis IT-1]|uniref:Uncharacterized protein n=1 Tax=Magnetofaba australis IT-1 TaxID=1434232 RepID=A0A1Y2K957_9PROT|nr:hypothetical protein MAIT1_03488 [Magnetofaba australis IT-1]